MSRIGNKPIAVPAGVDVKIDGNTVEAKGKNGTLKDSFDSRMSIQREGDEILVSRSNDNPENRSLHGLTRTLINNMVVGVSEGFTKELEVQGVGYRVAKQGKDLVMTLGYSHQVVISEIDGISIDVPAPNRIIVTGSDKQKVGHFAAVIRSKRPPEPYKGKGIRYLGEYVARKEGKAGKK